MKKKVTLSLFIAILLFSVTSVGVGHAKVVSKVSDDEVQNMAMEFEYIFTKILIKDESTGKYQVNEVELKNSPYTELEKKALVFYADNMNNKKISSSNDRLGDYQIQADNTFTRCMAEAMDISQSAVSQLMSYIDKGDWIGAAGVLGAMGIMISPPAIFLFAMFCGAGSAS